jgi:hypothetical protein
MGQPTHRLCEESYVFGWVFNSSTALDDVFSLTALEAVQALFLLVQIPQHWLIWSPL